MSRSLVLFFCLMLTTTQASDRVSQDLIIRIAQEEGIPLKLLKSITYVESGFHPWSVNVAGQAHRFSTRQAAEVFLDQRIQQGQTQFDIGCTQINWPWHGHHFQHPKELLSPETSLRTAARLLKAHKRLTRSWMKAALLYHSARPQHQQSYRRRLVHYLTQGPRG